jgi:cell division transport system permease protein
MSKTWKNLMLNIKKEKLLSLSNIIVMVVTFMILGTLINIIVYSQTALRMLEQQAQLTLFFKDDFTQEKILQLQDTLKKDKRISEVKYVSKEDAFKIFTDINKDEPILLESISANILPASLEIRTKQLSSLDELAKEYSSADGVEEVKFFKDVVDTFKYWSGIVYAVGFALLLIFITISYTVIISTLRTTIHSKGTELEILKLVGASDQYVKSPLIMQGVFFGAISALISSALLVLLTAPIKLLGAFRGGLTLFFVPGLNVDQIVFSLIVSVLLVVSGIALGYLGSLTAVKKYLKY